MQLRRICIPEHAFLTQDDDSDFDCVLATPAVAAPVPPPVTATPAPAPPPVTPRATRKNRPEVVTRKRRLEDERSAREQAARARRDCAQPGTMEYKNPVSRSAFIRLKSFRRSRCGKL